MVKKPAGFASLEKLATEERQLLDTIASSIHVMDVPSVVRALERLSEICGSLGLDLRRQIYDFIKENFLSRVQIAYDDLKKQLAEGLMVLDLVNS